MNQTLVKFGYPDTVIKSYAHWSVLLRPQQVTLGSLVLANHGQAQAFSELKDESMTELSTVVKDIESALTRCFKYDKINYLMLMMVDPEVHFHVLPRYKDAQEFQSNRFVDSAWPGPPDLGNVVEITTSQLNALQQHLISHWARD